MAARRRGGARDLLLSMIALGVVLVGAVAFVNAQHSPAQKVQAVDFAIPLRALRAEAPFPVYAPSPVPAGWLANHAIAHVRSASDASYSWDLGFYLPSSDEYAAVEQSDAPSWLATQLGGGRKETGETTVGTVAWQTWTDSAGRPALVRDVTGSTLVVDGKATALNLRALAAALSTR